jgi:hypothetical protein
MEAITDSAVDRRVSANAEICPEETPRGCISAGTDRLRQSNVLFHSYEVQFIPFNRHALLFSITTMCEVDLRLIHDEAATVAKRARRRRERAKPRAERNRVVAGKAMLKRGEHPWIQPFWLF